jgi:hypothetical protein
MKGTITGAFDDRGIGPESCTANLEVILEEFLKHQTG